MGGSVNSADLDQPGNSAGWLPARAWSFKRWYGKYGGLTHLKKVVFDAMLDEEAVRRLDWIKWMRSKGYGEESWMDWWPKWSWCWREFLGPWSRDCLELPSDSSSDSCGEPEERKKSAR